MCVFFKGNAENAVNTVVFESTSKNVANTVVSGTTSFLASRAPKT